MVDPLDRGVRSGAAGVPVLVISGAVGVVVVRLRAPVEVIHSRIRDHNRSDPEWYLEAATELSRSMEEQPIEDHLVENGALSIAETAREVLRVTRWAGPTDPD